MLNWLCPLAYISVVVAAPFMSEDLAVVSLQAAVVIVLLDMVIVLRKPPKNARPKKLLYYAFIVQAMWIALTDGRIRYTQEYARGEAVVFAVICLVLLIMNRLRGNACKRSA